VPVKSDSFDLPAQLRAIHEAEYPRFSDAEMAHRRAAVAGLLLEAGLDHLVFCGANRFGSAAQWLTGWPVTAEAVGVFTPGRPDDMFVQHVNHVPLARLLAAPAEVAWGGGSCIASAIAALEKRAAKNGRVGVIGPMTFEQHAVLAAKFGAIANLNRRYGRLRQIKSAEELDWMRIGAAMTDRGMLALREALRPGLSERDLADIVERAYVALGGVNVIRGAASAKPADYRAAAQAAGADVYFSGSIVPVFNQFSAIENLVSTHSGTVVWSVSIQFRSIADVTGQGARVRDELYHGAPAPPAGIAANGSSLVTSPPMSGYAVLPVTGSASGADRAYALNAIVDALKSRGHNVAPVTSSNAIDPVTGGALVCTTSGAQALVVGSLDTTRVATNGPTPQTTAHIDLRTFDCRSHELELKPTVVNHIAPVADDAIRGAVEDAISAFPAPS